MLTPKPSLGLVRGAKLVHCVRSQARHDSSVRSVMNAYFGKTDEPLGDLVALFHG